jgi:hypothetical protein
MGEEAKVPIFLKFQEEMPLRLPVRSQVIIGNCVVCAYTTPGTFSIVPLDSAGSVPANTPRLSWGSLREDSRVLSGLASGAIPYSTIFH